MPCITGMITDLVRRKAERELEHRSLRSSLRNWRVYRTELSRAQAQALGT